MRFITTNTYEEMSRKASRIIFSQVIGKPNCVLGLATGSSPIGTYKELIDLYNKGDLDFSTVTSVNLDEYVGLDGTNDQSYRYFMNENLFKAVNIPLEKTYVPNGCAEDLEKEGEAYDKLIEDLGGIDLQLLGIGLDGHIGFNEPDEFFTAATHCVDLDESTIKANARFFESEADVPRKAITMGMKSIMNAKKVLVLTKRRYSKRHFSVPLPPKSPHLFYNFTPMLLLFTAKINYI